MNRSQQRERWRAYKRRERSGEPAQQRGRPPVAVKAERKPYAVRPNPALLWDVWAALSMYPGTSYRWIAARLGISLARMYKYAAALQRSGAMVMERKHAKGGAWRMEPPLYDERLKGWTDDGE